MKKNFFVFMAIIVALIFFTSSCGKEEKKADKKSDSTEVSKDEPKSDGMTIEQIAEKRASLECEMKELSVQVGSVTNEDEKKKINDQITKLGDEINALNIQFSKNYTEQEDMEKHQKLYEELVKKCE